MGRPKGKKMKKEIPKKKKPYLVDQGDLTLEEWEKWNVEYFGTDDFIPIDSEDDGDVTEELNFDR